MGVGRRCVGLVKQLKLVLLAKFVSVYATSTRLCKATGAGTPRLHIPGSMGPTFSC